MLLPVQKIQASEIRLFKLLPDVISPKQIVYSSLLMNRLYLATDFNPFLLTPDSMAHSAAGELAEQHSVQVMPLLFLGWLSEENTLSFQWNIDFTVPCSWLYIVPVFLPLAGDCSRFFTKRPIIPRL